MSISLQELLHGHVISDIPIAEQHNLEELLVKMNKVRAAYGKPMIITSGYRSEQDQKRINPKAMNSKHRTGNACDVLDNDGKLHEWCKANEKLLTEIGLWLENRQGNWIHFQAKPFGSYKPGGTIWFNP